MRSRAAGSGGSRAEPWPFLLTPMQQSRRHHPRRRRRRSILCDQPQARRGRRVLLLDHATEAGGKILISGGGRCNFTNLHTAPDRFFSDNPHFCKSALHRYTQHDFVALVETHGIAYHEKTLGPAVLLRFGACDCRNAAGRVRCGGGGFAAGAPCHRHFQGGSILRRDGSCGFHSGKPGAGDRAACRSRSSGRRIFRMRPRDGSGCG